MTDDNTEDLFEDLDGLSDLTDGEAGKTGDAEPSLDDVFDSSKELTQDDDQALADRIASMSSEELAALIRRARGDEDPPDRTEKIRELEAGSKEALAEQRKQAKFDFAAANQLMRDFKAEEEARKNASAAIALEQLEDGPSSEEAAAIESIDFADDGVISAIAEAVRLGDVSRARRLARAANIPLELIG